MQTPLHLWPTKTLHGIARVLERRVRELRGVSWDLIDTEAIDAAKAQASPYWDELQHRSRAARSPALGID